MKNANDNHRHETAKQEKERSARESALKIAKQQIHKDMIQLLELPAFQRYMHTKVMARTQILANAMTGDLFTQYNLGRQSIGQEIWVELASVNEQAALRILVKDGD